MDDSFKLGEPEHDRIYKRIEKERFGQSTPVDRAKVVITGGQPGSALPDLLPS